MSRLTKLLINDVIVSNSPIILKTTLISGELHLFDLVRLKGHRQSRLQVKTLVRGNDLLTTVKGQEPFLLELDFLGSITPVFMEHHKGAMLVSESKL